MDDGVPITEKGEEMRNMLHITTEPYHIEFKQPKSLVLIG